MNDHLHRHKKHSQFVVDTDGRLLCGTCRNEATGCLVKLHSVDTVAPVTSVDITDGRIDVGPGFSTTGEDEWWCTVCEKPAVLPAEVGQR